MFKYIFQTCPMKGRSDDTFHEQFSERFMDHVRQVCTFAKLIPGFKCLHHDDQVTLLKSCVFEVLLVRLAGLFDNQVCFTTILNWYTFESMNYLFFVLIINIISFYSKGSNLFEWWFDSKRHHNSHATR